MIMIKMKVTFSETKLKIIVDGSMAERGNE